MEIELFLTKILNLFSFLEGVWGGAERGGGGGSIFF